MFKHLLTLFLFLTAVEAVMGQRHVTDSLENLIKKHPQDDTIKVNLLNDLSYHFRWIDFLHSQHDAEQALRIAQQLHYHKGIATADYRIGHCYWALGDNELAIEKGLEAAAIAERENFQPILAESFQIVARGYMDQKESAKAELYILKAEKISLQIKNWDLLSRVYNLAGVIQFIQNNKDSALQLYSKALSIVEEQSTSKAQLAQITSNIGECYLTTNPDLAFTYFKSALLIATSPKARNKSAEAAISSIMGHASITKGNYKEAEYYLQKSLRLSRELGLKRSIRHAYAGLVNLKIREGKASEALMYLKKYYDVHDSLLNVAKTRQIVELESRQELEKKEHAIQLLERDNKIQMLWTYILVAVLALTGILSVAIYYLQQYRERKNLMILNLEIDRLTTQNNELSEKYKGVLASGNAKSIESIDQRLFKKAIEVVEENISDPLFGVEQMSKELGMSRTNMHRKLKAITGFPPSELIRNIRLRKAASLLLNKADTVSQISLMVGFEDHSYFSKSFKKQFGVTPSEYLSSKERLN
jgi:AraC-like DNA-binding protein/tetratricopeptide (TPR) repeat protein